MKTLSCQHVSKVWTSPGGLSVEALGEVMAVVGLFNSTNAIAHGYQIEPDVFPPLD